MKAPAHRTATSSKTASAAGKGRTTQSKPSANAGKAPVYVYNFAWKSPVDNGIWLAPHTADIPFAFGTMDIAKTMTGNDPSAAEVSRSLMSAFVAFARTGDPNHPGIPAWKPYDTASRPTMVVKQPCRLVNDYLGADRVAS